MIVNFFLEIYLFLFIASIVFFTYIITTLLIKAYGRFKMQNETRFVISQQQLITLWVSITIILTYIF